MAKLPKHARKNFEPLWSDEMTERIRQNEINGFRVSVIKNDHRVIPNVELMISTNPNFSMTVSIPYDRECLIRVRDEIDRFLNKDGGL